MPRFTFEISVSPEDKYICHLILWIKLDLLKIPISIFSAYFCSRNKFASNFTTGCETPLDAYIKREPCTIHWNHIAAAHARYLNTSNHELQP